MSLLLDALKKAAEDKTIQPAEAAPLSNQDAGQGAEQIDNDLQPLGETQEALLDGEPIDFNASLADSEAVEDWDEELELDEAFLAAEETDPEIDAKADIIEEAIPSEPASLTNSSPTSLYPSEVGSSDIAPPSPEESTKQTPVYGSSDHAQVVFASKGEKDRRVKMWLLLVLLLLLLLGLIWWLFEALYPSLPVRARVAQLPVYESTNNASKLEGDVSSEAEGIVEVIPSAPVSTQATKPKAKPRNVKRPSSSKTSPSRRLSIQKSTKEDTMLGHLQRGYDEYQQGNYGPARIAYSRALEADKNNRDARLGLAATAMGQAQQDPKQYLDQYAVAQMHYQHLLQLNPQDAAARAGLIELDQRYAQGMSVASIKEAITSQPKAAPLHYSLANRYAQQRNWPQAQAAYFNAVSFAPANPDYHFNLAVSLDHLGKQQAALSYYQKAQSLAARKPHRFSLSALQQRIQQLQGEQP